jgi:hypothetical protein
MYYFIQNSEDGLLVTGCDHDEAMEHIKDLTGEEIRPEYRATFIDTIPNAYTNERNVCIIKGDLVVPEPVQLVTEYKL